MKKIVLFFAILQGGFAMQAQTGHTNTGFSSGKLGNNNSYYGYFSGNATTSSAINNSFFGFKSGLATTNGSSNTAIGSQAFLTNTTGSFNTATGQDAMFSNTIGSNNTATGYQALYSNTEGNFNTATGSISLYSNTTGNNNVGTGYQALYLNTTGNSNTSSGFQTLYSNTTGSLNSANGYNALISNIIGNFNSATGAHALRNNIADANTANGYSALILNTTGAYNCAIGYAALFNNATGNFNSALGYNAGPSSSDLSNTTALGNGATVTASNTVVIGNTLVTSIGGYQGWTNLSDGRFKRDLKEDVSGLNFISQLRPVSYSLDMDALDTFLGVPDSIKKQRSATRKAPIRQTGFVAQEVEAVVKKTGYVFGGIDAPKNEKDYYGIRYSEFVVPLVKAVQELSSQIIDQKKIVDDQQKKIDLLLNQLNNNGVKSIPSLGNEVALFQNAPNPFTVDTKITMTLPETAHEVYLMVYALDGKELKSILVIDRGNAVVKISANELNAGMYIYSLLVDNNVVDTKRMILTK